MYFDGRSFFCSTHGEHLTIKHGEHRHYGTGQRATYETHYQPRPFWTVYFE